MRILVTRPANLAKDLCNDIKSIGATPELLSVIEFCPTPHQSALHTAIQQMDTANMAVFISPTAAQFALQAIKNVRSNLNLNLDLPSLTWVAIGPGTAKILQAQGINGVVYPSAPPYETESLLTLNAFQSFAVHKKKILIFRGNGGRDLLDTELKRRGADVQLIETYQRQLPTINMVERLAKWRHNPIDVIVTTSATGLRHLRMLIDTTNDSTSSQTFQDTPIVVVGSRMMQLAITLGFNKPILSMGADDTSIMRILTQLKDKLCENGSI